MSVRSVTCRLDPFTVTINALWLSKHPGIKVISRDRGDEYKRGATEGAPQAIQVADRFHLLWNLRDAVARIIDRHRQAVQAAAQRTLRIVKEENKPGEEPAAKPVYLQQESLLHRELHRLSVKTAFNVSNRFINYINKVSHNARLHVNWISIAIRWAAISDPPSFLNEPLDSLRLASRYIFPTFRNAGWKDVE